MSQKGQLGIYKKQWLVVSLDAPFHDQLEIR